MALFPTGLIYVVVLRPLVDEVTVDDRCSNVEVWACLVCVNGV